MRALFAIFALLVLVAPARADFPDVWMTASPTHGDGEWQNLEADRFLVLPVGKDSDALRMLARKPVVALSSAAFKKILPGMPYPVAPDRRPFLIRGIEVVQSLGSIHVLQYQGEILADYNGPLERGDTRRRAIVVFLPASPRKLYVTVTLNY